VKVRLLLNVNPSLLTRIDKAIGTRLETPHNILVDVPKIAATNKAIIMK